jgi:hypothetical protein
MSFKFTSPQQIKSVSQHALASHWDRLAAGRPFPAFVEFTPEPLMHEPKQLVVWDIEGEGHQRKFRALYQGENVAEVFSSAWAGKTMDQVVPRPLRRFAMEAANECVASGCLIYTVVSTIDTNEHQVDCERLLLPFGRDGSKVEQILACLQLTSRQGVVWRKKVLNNFQMQADELFSGKIKSGFTKTKLTSTTSASDVHVIAFGKHPEPNERLAVSKVVPALDAAIGKKQRASRRNVSRAARISFAEKSMTCIVRNISATGALLEGANLTRIPDTFTLVLEMESAERLCAVVWRKETQVGVRFEAPGASRNSR